MDHPRESQIFSKTPSAPLLGHLQPVLLSDSGGKYDKTGRMLYLTDGSGRKVHVGLAPVYGSRLDTIAEDLYRAIDMMKPSD